MNKKEILKQLIKILKASLSLSFVVSILVFFISFKYGNNFVAQGNIIVESIAPLETSQKYTYGGYYSQQKAASFSENLPKLLTSPTFINNALVQANIYKSSGDIKKLTKNIIVKKSGPQAITFSIKGRGSEETKNIWVALYEQTKSVSLEVSKISNENYIIYGEQNAPFVFKKSLAPYTNASASFLLVNFFIFLAFYIKSLHSAL